MGPPWPTPARAIARSRHTFQTGLLSLVHVFPRPGTCSTLTGGIDHATLLPNKPQRVNKLASSSESTWRAGEKKTDWTQAPTTAEALRPRDIQPAVCILANSCKIRSQNRQDYTSPETMLVRCSRLGCTPCFNIQAFAVNFANFKIILKEL